MQLRNGLHRREAVVGVLLLAPELRLACVLLREKLALRKLGLNPV